MMSGSGTTGARRRWPWRRAAHRFRGGLAEVELTALPALLAVVTGVGLGAGFVGPDVVPPGVLLLPLLASGFLVRVAGVRIVVAATAVMIIFDATSQGIGHVRVGNVVAVAVGAALALWLAAARERVGVPGLRGESMLLELRDKLREQGELPLLPAGWAAETRVESAGGASFGGDFMVSSLTDDGKALEIVLVDVSGKGVSAGTRALLLSGALGGLLGSVPAESFLAEANRYLLRQEWEEGFATAVHLVIDLVTGQYRLETGGHPPAVHFDAGSGTWRPARATGAALGLIGEAGFEPESGVLRPGDALLLYTDGVVEIPGRDLAVGIDKLLGEAERLVPRGFTGGAQRLLDAMRSRATDDRAVVLIWRP